MWEVVKDGLMDTSLASGGNLVKTTASGALQMETIHVECITSLPLICCELLQKLDMILSVMIITGL